ncbi:MAG TPA: bifunctional YncE family protein/alkaline phosphatase family protein [Tepidisphaeraceae bacterium]|jgi:YVTN family beta-propeller protein
MASSVRRITLLLLALSLFPLVIGCRDVNEPSAQISASPPASTRPVGSLQDDATLVPTGQLIRPPGQSVHYHGRPVDLALSRDGKIVFVKDSQSLLAIDAAQWKILDQVKYPKSGASLHGLVASKLTDSVFVTTTNSGLRQAKLDAQGKLDFVRSITLKRDEPNERQEDSYPCGLALSADEKTAYVCLNASNELAIVDLGGGAGAGGKLVHAVPVGMAPYAVVISPDEKTAYVSNWAGRRPTDKDKTAKSAGSDVVTDDRGITSTGTVSVIDLPARKVLAEIPVGLHPSALAMTGDGTVLYVANASSDTISVIDTAARKGLFEIPINPSNNLPFGSLPNAIHLSPDHETLYTANGGNNAIAVIRRKGGEYETVKGFIPTAWFPSAVISDGDGNNLYIANAKGQGSRDPDNVGKWNSHSYWATVTKVKIPDAATLERYTEQVHRDAQIPQVLAAQERSRSTDVKPVPVPQKIGEPSLFKHVIYIIKENRTYDQVFGDLKQGNGDASLCTFGREVTPNHHALAERFVLLDNYYCNGVLSADGHAWVTQGIANDYLERSFGGWVRSYPFGGDDPQAFASSGFIWDSALAAGLSFRNFGEMTTTRREDKTTWLEIYRDWKSGTNKIKLNNITTNAALRRFSNPDSPGWNMRVTDQIRADAFLKELDRFTREKSMPNLMTIFLPGDHTLGTSPDAPTPAAMVADNDLALGRIVEAVSKSPFWKETAIFVTEDDPQAGFDHVDGHRSLCLVISPHTRRGQTISHFYNQTSILHTINLILGLPPMTQIQASAPPMHDCFISRDDIGAGNLEPYECLKNNIPLDQMNPLKSALNGKALELAELSEQQRWDAPDLANEDALNRILWHASKGISVPYPAQLAGAHGKGLARLRLKLDANVQPDEDDD